MGGGFLFGNACLEGTTERSNGNRVRSARREDTHSMCLEGTTPKDMYGYTPVALYGEPVLGRSAFQAHRTVLVDPDTACPVTIASLCSAFQALNA